MSFPKFLRTSFFIEHLWWLLLNHRILCEKNHFFVFILLTMAKYIRITNNNKQIFHAFLFNIRNYPPKVINIQRRETELNIILPRVNNFDIKQKKVWNICFIICHQHQARSGKIKTNKTQQILVKTQVFLFFFVL